MANILWLMLIPIVWCLISKFVLHKNVTWKEAGLKCGVGALFVIILYGAFAYSNLADRLILNGYVTGKKKEWVSCEHSYRCNCYTTCTGSGSSRSCSESCSTCYEHLNDWDWNVFSTVGKITINRVDRRGSEMPPRWAAVKLGEPAAVEQHYVNYIKAAPNSLFNVAQLKEEQKTIQHLLPPYPSVYDYYKVHHTVLVNGAQIPNRAVWDELLSSVLRKLGAEKQVNINVVFAQGLNRDYALTLERAWLGGKKNDVTIVVGVDKQEVKWVEAFTFGKTAGNGILAVRLRDRLQGNVKHTDEVHKAVSIITAEVRSNFKRKSMKEYEYLRSEGGPTATQIGWLIGTLMLLLAGLTYVMWKYDVFNEESRYFYRRFY